jgi:hypothetical protein
MGTGSGLIVTAPKRPELNRLQVSHRNSGTASGSRRKVEWHVKCAAMIHDLITAFLVAVAAVTASEVLARIWESLY